MTIYRNTVMKQHDTAPALRVTLLDGTTPIDTTAATGIRFVGTRPDGTALNRSTAERGPTGVVTLVWQAADTATPGSLRFEVEVTWPDSTVQTFPANGTVRVDIQTDQG